MLRALATLPDENYDNSNIKPTVCKKNPDSAINLQPVEKGYRETKRAYIKRKRSEESYCQSENDSKSKRYKVMKTQICKKRGAKQIERRINQKEANCPINNLNKH